MEPENRLVARELERRWEDLLLEERRLREEYARVAAEHSAELSEQDRADIQSLSTDLPALWHSPTTTIEDRQVVVRQLVERVVIAIQGELDLVDVSVRWTGGFVSHHEIARSVRRYEQLHDYMHMTARLTELNLQGWSSARIACQLNDEGFHTARGTRREFTAASVRKLRAHLGLSRKAVSDHLQADEWSAHDLGRKLNIPFGTMKDWIDNGWVHARKVRVGAERWIVWADADELHRLARLHSYRRPHPSTPHPADLTTPKLRKKG